MKYIHAAAFRAAVCRLIRHRFILYYGRMVLLWEAKDKYESLPIFTYHQRHSGNTTNLKEGTNVEPIQD
jgi:hypothetical protein